MTESWHEGMAPFMRALEYVGTLAGAVSGIRLACRKRFDWFGAYVIGFVTAVGGGTLRDVMLLRHPFWMTDGSYVLTTVVALAAVWLFGRRFIGGQVTWFVFDTVAISVFMVIGMEKTIVVFEAEAPGVDCAWWVAVAMGVKGAEKMPLAKARKAAVAAVEKLAKDVGIPADLKGVLKKDDIKFLAESAYADACRPGNPRDCTVADIEKLYKSLA